MKPLNQLTDAELVDLARDKKAPDHIRTAAFDEGLKRVEKKAKARHAKGCPCASCTHETEVY
jgi:hypothetical protein